MTTPSVSYPITVPRILNGADIAAMADDAVVFALANPDPKVDPDEAREHAAVVAAGRSDYPNQTNNVLAFPGVFRGLLDAQSRNITEPMLIAAARALAGRGDPRRTRAQLHRAEPLPPGRGGHSGRRRAGRCRNSIRNNAGQ